MDCMLHDTESQKLIKDLMRLMNQYNVKFILLIDEIKRELDMTPPCANDTVLFIYISCWFNKSFYVSMFLLKDHSVSNSFIAHQKNGEFRL